MKLGLWEKYVLSISLVVELPDKLQMSTSVSYICPILGMSSNCFHFFISVLTFEEQKADKVNNLFCHVV